MLKLLKLQFGASSGSETLDFQPGSMTVFVGPNNSGKSLLLREIEQYMGNIPGQSSPTKIVSSLDLNPIRISDVIRIIFPENP
jgi:ABC-type hemin transport system ATPase subunit